DIAVHKRRARLQGLGDRHVLVHDEEHRELREEPDDQAGDPAQKTADGGHDGDDEGGADHPADVVEAEGRADRELPAVGYLQRATQDHCLHHSGDDDGDDHHGRHDHQYAEEPAAGAGGVAVGVDLEAGGQPEAHGAEEQQPHDVEGRQDRQPRERREDDRADVLLELRPSVVERVADVEALWWAAEAALTREPATRRWVTSAGRRASGRWSRRWVASTRWWASGRLSWGWLSWGWVASTGRWASGRLSWGWVAAAGRWPPGRRWLATAHLVP